MSDPIELQYFKDFLKKDYDAAVQLLWEQHCKSPDVYPWPPTLDQIKQEIRDRQASNRDAR